MRSRVWEGWKRHGTRAWEQKALRMGGGCGLGCSSRGEVLVRTTRQRNHTALRKSSAKNSPAPEKGASALAKIPPPARCQPQRGLRVAPPARCPHQPGLWVPCPEQPVQVWCVQAEQQQQQSRAGQSRRQLAAGMLGKRRQEGCRRAALPSWAPGEALGTLSILWPSAGRC